MDLKKVIEKAMMGRKNQASGGLRVPFYFGSERLSGIDVSDFFGDSSSSVGEQFFKSLIRMKINPNSLVISQEKRITDIKTAGGRTYFHWLRKGKSSDDYYSNDVMKIKIKGETGNINLRSPDGVLKLYTYLKLRDLTAEPRLYKVMDKGGKSVYKVNRAFCILRTPALPFVLLFVGFFQSVMTITDIATAPFQKSWELDFVVEAVFPDMVEISQYMLPEVIPSEQFQGVIGA